MNEKAGGQNCDTDTSADMESFVSDVAYGQKGCQAQNPRYSIHIHSKRKRLADPDGISAKAAIDGIVRAGLLPDDSHDYIKEITFSQEKSQTNETIIEIYEEAD